jgi:hypothetical protein
LFTLRTLHLNPDVVSSSCLVWVLFVIAVDMLELSTMYKQYTIMKNLVTMRGPESD